MWWNRKKKPDDREAERIRKVQESQHALLFAATSTADVAQDVTTKLKARLDDSLRQLESTANLLCDALIICKSDGTITSVNPAAERIFGWTSGDVVGRSLTTIFKNEQGQDVTTEMILECLSDNHDCDQTLIYQHTIDCVRGKRKSGELFYVDGDITYLERLDGTTIVMLLIRDITTRIDLQRQLQVSETRYRGIFESTFDGILVVQNYHIVAANPAITTLLGYSTEEMIAKSTASFFHPDSQKIINENHTARMNGESSSKHYIVLGVDKQGNERELLFSSAAMEWEGRTASLISVKDISEILKAINSK